MTAPRFLLDTNILIHIRRSCPPRVAARFTELAVGEAAISVVTYGELRFGAEKSAERERALSQLAELVQLLPVLPLNDAAAEAYGHLRAELERKGAMIGGNDLWIGAQALAAGLMLVTNNRREFDRIPGLPVED